MQCHICLQSKIISKQLSHLILTEKSTCLPRRVYPHYITLFTPIYHQYIIYLIYRETYVIPLIIEVWIFIVCGSVGFLDVSGGDDVPLRPRHRHLLL